MLTNRKLYQVLTIVFGALFLGGLVTYTTLEFLDFFSHVNKVIPFLIVIFLMGSLAMYFTNFLRWMTGSNLLRSLKNENLYSFGKETIYFNRAVFENVVTSFRKRRVMKNAAQTLIAFSTSAQSMALNSSRRNTIIQFNALVISFLDKYFTEHRSSLRHVYCFDEGIFMIYCFGDSRIQVVNLVNTINDQLYKIAEENGIHILVTPYFGIDEVKPRETLTEAIENASIARNISERNFEVLNFYKSGLRSSSTTDDAEEIVAALKNKEFVVYYQPKYDLLRDRFISSEALIRWNSPTKGLLPPSMFVEKAQAAGLSHELDMYVFERVCEDIAENRKRGRRVLPVSLNFSLYEFYSSNFLDTIINTLKKYKVDPRLIQVEILETTSQANPFLSVSIIKKLKEMGIRVLMDDFGIGYSNIGNLSKIPFDTIKIDKSYVDDIVKDKRARQICQCLVDLGKINGMEVIAEGVDSLEQVNLLRMMGCDTIQGFYFSKPLSKNEFDKFLLDNPFEAKEEY